MPATSQVFARDLRFPEGPVLLPDGSWAVVEIAGAPGCITHISADGRTRRRIADLTRPNGLAVDRNGTIWCAESRQGALLRVTLGGAVEVVAAECDGEPFLFPNDLCFGPDGLLYLTDSGIRVDDFAPGNVPRADWPTLTLDGRIFRVDPSSGSVALLDRGIPFTNGIAFSEGRGNRTTERPTRESRPSGQSPESLYLDEGETPGFRPSGGMSTNLSGCQLYANSTLDGAVFRYPQTPGPRQPFANVVDPDGPAGLKGPDGMCFDREGNLYVATVGQGQVVVVDPAGNVTARLRTQGLDPTNCAFGPAGSGTLYVTEAQLGQIEVFDVGAEGLPLWT